MLKHIIFDCDGVLWQGTNEGYVKCYHRAAVEAGIHLDYSLARERILANWGTSAEHEVEGMVPDHPHLVPEIVARYRRLVRSDLFLSTATLVPGTQPTLQTLSRRFGLSAITGMNTDNLAKLLNRFDLSAYFRHVISTGETNDPTRQKGTGYHLGRLLHDEAISPDEALCVGDAPVDVQMAQRQQVPVVVVLTGHLDAQQAHDLCVDAVVDSVADLPSWIATNHFEGVSYATDS